MSDAAQRYAVRRAKFQAWFNPKRTNAEAVIGGFGAGLMMLGIWIAADLGDSGLWVGFLVVGLAACNALLFRFVTRKWQVPE